jgi:Flp pilus assembly protein TadG
MRKSRQQGVALVEFALAVPLLLMLSFITVEFGRALHQYNVLAKSVRDAARYLSMQAPGTRTAEARNLVLYGTTTAGSTPLVHGLTAAHVPDPVWQTAGSLPLINTVTVQVTGYTFQPLVTAPFGLAFPGMQFTPIQATMRSPL